VLALALIYLYGPRSRSTPVQTATWRHPKYRITPSLAWLTLVPLGLALYLGYMGLAHNQPFAPLTAEAAVWGRTFAGPFGGAVQALSNLPTGLLHVLTGHATPLGPGQPLSWDAQNLIDLAFLAFAIVGLAAAWRHVPIAYFAYALALLAQATSYPRQDEPLPSLPRYLAVIFPIFIGWALLLRPRPRLTKAVITGSTILLIVFSGLWTTWAWIA
jgi:hypothetical protein